ncbi:MAG TPA: type II secretion system F family protein [Gemmatimonadales bacterium]|nr:type II secretion system F family protein [Gemmatimonadales bacterium]
MIKLAQGVAELQRPKLKAAYYRQRHLQQRAGLGRPERPPGCIAPFEAALLKLGEESGKLEECLNLLAEYFAAEQRVMLEVVRKTTYPMFVALAATFIAPLPVAFAGRLTAYFLTVGAGLAMWLVAARC